mmetsp:Transcript_26142/g.26371  ORF Transcript_26142/g.26371 Transcript_26142/m.26371 type:complete len:188 (+) Transcript_26142:334-897(+)
MDENNNLLFVDTIFLRTFGLSQHNVLDYFSLSPFYDSSSNNQAIRTQGANIDNLINMIGLEFVLDSNTKEKNLFVIKKQLRSSPRAAELLDIYYVLDLGESYFVIYKTPNLLDALRTRNQKITLYLQKSFTSVLERVEFSGSMGHYFPKKHSYEEIEETSPYVKPTVREFPSFTTTISDIMNTASDL